MKRTSRARLPRLSDKEALILGLLVARPGMYGLELVDESAGGLKRGTVYVTLGRMEEKGYVRSRPDAAIPERGGLPRRLYEATPLGVQLHRAWTGLVQALRLEIAR